MHQQQLVDLGYDALLVDFHGSGGSPGNETTLGADEAKDVVDAMNYVQEQWPDKKVILYGMSMGAAAILRAVALEDAAPDAIILEAPFDRLINSVRHRFNSAGVPSSPGAEMLILWGSIDAGFNGFAHDPVDYASAVDCPALLFHGEEDHAVTVKGTDSIVAHLRGEATLVNVPGMGHDLTSAIEPELWHGEVAAFLAQRVNN